jgi:hypothetical protein
MWAMLGKTMITKMRGVVHVSTHTMTGFKVLPTYHPAAILRQESWRPVTIMDLQKARRESASPQVTRPERTIWIEPTMEDILEFDRQHIQPCERLSVDTETAGTIITCIGFAPSPSLALVVPFVDPRRAGRAYWPTLAIERQIWKIVKDILSRPTSKTFQNGLYDIAFLWRSYGIRVMGASDDTMLLHHALQPETLKSLGFLGSLYTDEGPWKDMRQKVKTIKRED